MKEFKVETLIYYSKLPLDKNHIANASKIEIQKKPVYHAKKGWRLVSTDASNLRVGPIYLALF